MKKVLLPALLAASLSACTVGTPGVSVGLGVGTGIGRHVGWVHPSTSLSAWTKTKPPKVQIQTASVSQKNKS